MTLKELIQNLPELDRSSTVYVEDDQPLKASSKVQLIDIPEEADLPPTVPGMRCFMDVWQIRDVLSGKARLHRLEEATIDQQLEMLLSFAKHDA